MTQRLKEVLDRRLAEIRASKAAGEARAAAAKREAQALAEIEAMPRPPQKVMPCFDDFLEELRHDVRVLRVRADAGLATYAEVDKVESGVKHVANGFSPVRRAAIYAEMKRDLGGIRWTIEQRLRETTGPSGRAMVL